MLRFAITEYFCDKSNFVTTMISWIVQCMSMDIKIHCNFLSGITFPLEMDIC